MKSVSFTYRIKEKDYITVNLWSSLEKTKFMRILNRYLIYGLDFLMMILALISSLPVGYFFFLLFIAMVTFLLRVGVIVKAKKKYYRNALLQEHDMTVYISDDIIRETFLNLSYESKWSEVRSMQLVNKILMIDLKDSRVLFVPVEAITEEDYHLLHEIVKRKIPLNKLRLPGFLDQKSSDE